MADFDDVRRIALALPHVVEVPHFDKTAFRVKRIFASGRTGHPIINLLLNPGQQQFWIEGFPAMCRPLPNKWGLKGWTELDLQGVDAQMLGDILQTAWQNGSL